MQHANLGATTSNSLLESDDKEVRKSRSALTNFIQRAITRIK